jgi:hypothetical protein
MRRDFPLTRHGIERGNRRRTSPARATLLRRIDPRCSNESGNNEQSATAINHSCNMRIRSNNANVRPGFGRCVGNAKRELASRTLESFY